MNLLTYLQQPGKTATALALEVGCAVSTITRAARGDLFPSRKLQRKILSATGGLVTPADFVAIDTADQAEAA